MIVLESQINLFWVLVEDPILGQGSGVPWILYPAHPA